MQHIKGLAEWPHFLCIPIFSPQLEQQLCKHDPDIYQNINNKYAISSFMLDIAGGDKKNSI